jgi:hypothetical protein
MFSKDELKDTVEVTVDMLNIMLSTVKKKKTLEKLAGVAKAYYDELIKAGFSEDAAIKIASNFNLNAKR